jgi:phosphatidylinositol-3-phosphatase
MLPGSAGQAAVTERKWTMRTEAITAQRRPRWLRVFLTAVVVALPASVPLLGANPAAAEVVAPPASAPLLGANPAAAELVAPPASVPLLPPNIMVIVEENEGFANIIGSSKAPYINSLVSTSASATKWYGLTDNSLGDYVALISGTTGSYSSPTLVGELATSGISWKAYMEDMPSACYTGPGVGNYEKVHNPFVYFKSITSNPAQCNRVVPFAGSGGFASDLTGNTAPSFMFVVPNVCDDMHSTCSSTVNKIKQGDSWLKSNLATVMGSQWYTAGGGIVIITWDSATTADKSGWNTGSGGHIPTIVISANFSGAFSSGGNLYGTLRAIEDAYKVGWLGKSSSLANGDLGPAF